MATHKPVARFRAGQISCAVWENKISVDGRAATMLKATVASRFRGSDGDWRSSGSFSRNEIPLVIYCLQKAFGSMIEQADELPRDGDPVEEVVE